ncbi:hypothetical protein PAPYR_1309 [Paratrimastix pyriformis]|uniref:Major facilitator superfamily (MFS) profile domain-containing protein n=1 Tax=Paratrimastix pyriformis TaxID=342808 RepID=A0ABQ8USL7_9EUKA|nr:hypothetical protein PAPYR_1309 [Paratrimastix pyriformis]
MEQVKGILTTLFGAHFPVLLVGSMQALGGSIFQTAVPLFIQESFNVHSPRLFGAAIIAPVLGFWAGSYLVDPLTRRIALPFVISASLLLDGICTALGQVADSFAFFLILRFLGGIILAGTRQMNPLLFVSTPRDRSLRPIMASMAEALATVSVAGSLLGGLLVSRSGMSPMLWVSAALDVFAFGYSLTWPAFLPPHVFRPTPPPRMPPKALPLSAVLFSSRGTSIYALLLALVAQGAAAGCVMAVLPLLLPGGSGGLLASETAIPWGWAMAAMALGGALSLRVLPKMAQLFARPADRPAHLAAPPGTAPATVAAPIPQGMQAPEAGAPPTQQQQPASLDPVGSPMMMYPDESPAVLLLWVFLGWAAVLGVAGWARFKLDMASFMGLLLAVGFLQGCTDPLVGSILASLQTGHLTSQVNRLCQAATSLGQAVGALFLSVRCVYPYDGRHGLWLAALVALCGAAFVPGQKWHPLGALRRLVPLFPAARPHPQHPQHSCSGRCDAAANVLPPGGALEPPM